MKKLKKYLLPVLFATLALFYPFLMSLCQHIRNQSYDGIFQFVLWGLYLPFGALWVLDSRLAAQKGWKAAAERFLLGAAFLLLFWYWHLEFNHLWLIAAGYELGMAVGCLIPGKKGRGVPASASHLSGSGGTHISA